MNTKLTRRRILLSLLLIFVLGWGMSNSPTIAKEKDAEKEKKDDAIKTIKLDEVKENIGKKVRIEFKVLGANLKNEKSNCYLNSKKDHRAKDNFTIIIFPKNLKKFKEEKIDDPAMYYIDKTIQVTGKLQIHKDRRDNETTQIEVESPDQITVVKEEKADEKPVEGKAEKAK